MLLAGQVTRFCVGMKLVPVLKACVNDQLRMHGFFAVRLRATKVAGGALQSAE